MFTLKLSGSCEFAIYKDNVSKFEWGDALRRSSLNDSLDSNDIFI